MKKINSINKIGIALSVCLLIMLSGCTAYFDDLNADPGRPGQEDMGSSAAMILFPTMIDLMHNWQENDSQMIDQMVYNQYGGYMVTTNRWNATNFGTFNPQLDWHDDAWVSVVPRFYVNYNQIKQLSKGEGYLYAWANVIRVAVMLRVTDTYGPIPYSKVSPESNTWEYDDVQQVYHQMIADLTAAIPVLTQFNAGLGSETPLAAAYDRVYGGDFSKWVKFANSLKLRLAVRIGLVDTDYAKTIMAEAIAGGCITDNADNAYNTTTNNPYRLASTEWGDLAANGTLSVYLNGWNDPRQSVYLTGGGGDNRGVRPGIAYDSNGKATYSNGANYAKPNFDATSPMLLFCAAETYFLMAEAAQRGWIAGNAKSLYEQGITTSMAEHNVGIGSYLTATMTPASASYTDIAANVANNFSNLISAAGNTPLAVAWDAQTTDEMKIEAIITQKWLANYTLGAEAWSEFRRTGYPRMIPVRDNLSSPGTGGVVANPDINLITTNAVRLVRRLTYPQSERDLNSTNYSSAVNSMLGGADELATELWWAKGKQ